MRKDIDTRSVITGFSNSDSETYTLELTKEELDFIYTRCSRKAARLEEAHLEDIPCYHLSWQVMTKISKVRENQNILKGESV